MSNNDTDSIPDVYRCEICNKTFKSKKGLSSHVKQMKDHPSPEEYYNKYIRKSPDDGICPTCGKKTNFISIDKGYAIYCSVKCCSSNPEIKKRKRNTCLEKYGELTNLKTKEHKEKSKKTSLKKYGTEHPTQSDIVKERMKNTNIERYGVGVAMKNEDIKAKTKNTLLERYGVDNPLKVEEIKAKVRNTVREKYGVDCVFQSEAIKEKTKATNTERYGVVNPSKSVEIKNKISNTIKERYGVDWAMQSPEIQQKSADTCLKKYGVDNYFKTELFSELKNKIDKDEMVEKIFYKDRLGGKVIPKFAPEDYINTNTIYTWQCVICNTEFSSNLRNGVIPRCPTCYPIKLSSSKIEEELSEFCKNLNVGKIIRNTKDIITPYELDIYIPDKKFAIEMDGLYWHSEVGGKKDKNYHITKTDMCMDEDIQLIQIYEDEWFNKPDIIKSIIKSKLGVIENKVYARKCKIVEVENDIAIDFLDDNHLQGSINGTHIGLEFNGEVLCLVTIGKSRFDKRYDLEILRFCNKLNTIVVGGFSKIFKYIRKNYENKSIITYADKRYGYGKFYEYAGFTFVGETEPGFYYISSDYISRESRYRYQKYMLKDKISTYKESLTEWENMQLNGYDRIWDCGNVRWRVIA